MSDQVIGIDEFGEIFVHVESDAERINRIEQNQTQRHGEQNEKGSLFVSAQICRGHAGYFYAETSAAVAGDLRFRIADGFYRRYFGGDSAGFGSADENGDQREECTADENQRIFRTKSAR